MSDKNATAVVRADDEGIANAARILTDGGLVAVPTETVYGLAARADSAEAVARIYAAKSRPDFNPLIVHVADIAQAQHLAHFSAAARALADAHWPGPLTLVLPRRDNAALAPAVSAGLPTIALRVPGHRVMRSLLRAVNVPLAAPSANRSGYISPTSAGHVLASLDGRIDLVLDGGEAARGVESTILAVRANGEIEELRTGPLNIPQARKAASAHPGTASLEAPGQLASHYSPGKPVRLNAHEAAGDEFLIGFGAVMGDVTLSHTGNVAEAAACLYASLHKGAASPKPAIAVAPVPDIDEGRAINDRLRRAAVPPD